MTISIEGVESLFLTLANEGGGGSQMAKIMLMLLMDSPICILYIYLSRLFYGRGKLLSMGHYQDSN